MKKKIYIYKIISADPSLRGSAPRRAFLRFAWWLCVFFAGVRVFRNWSFFAWHGLESCWCFGLFESDADETLSSHCSESTFRTVFCLAEARLLLAFGCFGTEALFFIGSKGDVKHSICVFFAWHGLESCWCFGLFESDANETLSSHRSESTFRTVFGWQRFDCCWRSGVSEPDADETLAAIVRNPRFERFFAWLRLDCCWHSGVSEPKLYFFLWVPKVTWSILSACFLLGMGSNLAGVLVFSNLTLTRLWAAIVRNARFERFFVWQRLDCCWRSGTEALFFLLGSKGDVKHSVCVFFTWHGLESCWCFGLFESDADETLSSHRSESTFRTVFCLAEARLLLAFGCFGTEALFFLMGSKGDVKHSVCVFFAWHGLESCWCFGLFESDADEPLSNHCSESKFRTVFCLAEARLLLVFGCFGTEALFFIGSKGDVKRSVYVFFTWHGLESCFSNLTLTRLWAAIVRNPRFERVFAWQRLATAAGVRMFRNRSFVFSYGFQRWCEAFCLRVFCLAWARILLVFWSFRIWRWWDFEQPSFGIHVSNGFLLGRGSTAAGVRVFRNRSFVFFYGFQRWREAFCLRVFCLAWARILLVFWSFRIWRWRDFEQPSFGIHVSNGFLFGRGSTVAGVRVFRNRSFVFFLWVPKVTWSILSACFLLGMGSHLAGVLVFSNLTLTRLWAAIVRNPRFERFFVWQKLDCCWRSGVSEPKLCFFLWVPKVTWSILFACFLLGMGWNLAALSVFSNLTLTRLWAAIVRNPRFERFLVGRGSTAAGVRVFRNLTLTRLWAAIVRNARFERFFDWHRLDCCWCSGVSEPKLCFL